MGSLGGTVELRTRHEDLYFLSPLFSHLHLPHRDPECGGRGGWLRSPDVRSSWLRGPGLHVLEDTAVVVDMEDEKMAESPSVPLFAPLAVPHLTQGLQPWAGLLLPARTVGQYPQYPVFNTFPGLVWNTPALTPVQSLVPRVIGTEGLLPSQKLEGEDEPAALEF